MHKIVKGTTCSQTEMISLLACSQIRLPQNTDHDISSEKGIKCLHHVYSGFILAYLYSFTTPGMGRCQLFNLGVLG